MKRHDLKCWPGQFERVVLGLKRHEVRVDDRDFQPGDSVVLHEFAPPSDEHDGVYTGRTSSWLIGHVTPGGTFGLPAGVCCFSLLTELRSEQLAAIAPTAATEFAQGGSR